MAKIIDATNCIAGRLATKISKLMISGESVVVINAGKAVISGNPVSTARLYKEKFDRGDKYHGPFYPRAPDRIFFRIVRGMTSKKKPELMKKLQVFPGEKSFDKPQFVEVDASMKAQKLDADFITLEDLSKRLGKSTTHK